MDAYPAQFFQLQNRPRSGRPNPQAAQANRHDKYDRQLIILFLNGNGDKLIQDNAEALRKKGQRMNLATDMVTVRPGPGSSLFKTDRVPGQAISLKAALKPITAQSRVYLQAHGDWQSQKLASWDAKETARILCHYGEMTAAQTVSILGCELARDAGTTNDQRVSNSMDSYAQKFHSLLKSEHQIETVVLARTHCVGIKTEAEAKADGFPDRAGSKYSFDKDNQMIKLSFFGMEMDEDPWVMSHQAEGSKYKFYWENGQQKRDAVY